MGGVGCVQYIPVRPWDRRVFSSALGPFPCAVSGFGTFPCSRGWSVPFVCYRLIPWVSFACVLLCTVRHGRRRVGYRCIPVVGFFRVRSALSRAPWGSSYSFGCARSIPVLVRVRTLHSFGCIWSVPVRFWGGSGAFGLIPCSLGILGVVRARSVHSRTPLRLSRAFGSVSSIPVLCEGRQGDFAHPPLGGHVGSGAFGSFPCALGIVRVGRGLSAHSSAPWVS